MKFGRKLVLPKPSQLRWGSHISSLPRNQVPEWAAFYINYKGLKKLIKAASETAKAGGNVDLAGRASS